MIFVLLLPTVVLNFPYILSVFIYICLKDNDKCTPGWQSHNRNWELGKKCLITMCQKFNLKGAIIGRENCEFTDLCSGIVKILPFLKYHEFQKELQKAKFLFVPNITDASPRVLTEAMCLDLRLLVNYNLIGGWKYVTPETGEFFTDEFDIIPAIQKLVDNNYQRFVELISNGRKLEIAKVKAFSDGRIFSADEALEYKLIDEIGYFEKAERFYAVIRILHGKLLST